MGRGRQDMSIWVGMGMDRSAVAGYGKGAVGNEATFERGQYGNRIKKLLEPCLKVEREILAVKDSRNKGVRDGGTVFGSLLMPSDACLWVWAVFYGSSLERGVCPSYKGNGQVWSKADP